MAEPDPQTAPAGGRRRLFPVTAAERPVTAAILTDDPASGDGVRSYLRAAAGIVPVDPQQQSGADVLVVVSTVVTEQLLHRMGQAHPGRGSRQGVVLIADPPAGRQLALALRHGVVSIIPRRSATRELVTGAVLATGRGSAVMPGEAVRRLADLSRDFQDIAYAAHGVAGGGLTVRESDIIRLLADGMSTPEIAARLNYAERTIKNILHAVLVRHRLRNRAHAVAYAYRSGAI
jgi:DNA-binding NarL/FixJ family response regulator